jgi:putative SOS response-associated peptidase YedK
MCGRYTLSIHDGGRIADRFDTRDFPAPASGMLGRFNVCPGEQVLAVDADRVIRPLWWGLRLPGAKAPAPINARAETAGAKPMFSSLIAEARGRCLVPADGWYEWLRAERRGPRPAPFHHTVDGGEPFAFAGLHARDSVAILTTTPNAVCARLHDRMPVVLAGPEAEALWLDPGASAEDAAALLVPLAAERVAVAPASARVNSAGVEGAELLMAEPTLF